MFTKGQPPMFSSRSLSRLLTVILFLSAAVTMQAGGNDPWKPVDPAHLALKAPVVEKDADAEALFWEVFVEKGEEKAELRHSIRIKLFNQRACDEHGKVRILYSKGENVTEIAGRTIKPDGQIVELRPDAIFETTAYKYGKTKMQAKTFAMPGVEPGAIIEYRWRETRKDARFMALDFQLEIPVQSVKYQIKDNSSWYASARMKPMNMKDVLFKEEGKGLTSVSRANVPAFRREPQMPPETEVRGWMLLYHVYSSAEYNFWSYVSKDTYDKTKSAIKPNDEVKRAAESAIAGATTDMQKLERLYAFCQSKIKRADDDPSFSEQTLAKIKETKSPADTLRRGTGTGQQIDWLFAALANAVGFEARITNAGNREESFFDRNSPFTSPLECYHVAVRVGSEWKFFDPAGVHLPFGMLRWQEEGVESLISDPVQTNFVTTLISGPEKSKYIRKANLKLNEDGSLEGDVRVEFTGHVGAERKEALDEMSNEQRIKQLTDGLKTLMPAIELTDVKIENVNDPTKNLMQSYHVRVPDYAQRTGKRILIQPAFFQYGTKQWFPNKERRHPVYFHYPWSEEDEVTLQLPLGFEPENFAPPSPIRAQTVSVYIPQLQYNVESRTFVYKREFFFGGGGALIFPRNGSPEVIQGIYNNLKILFDNVHDRDNFNVSVKMNVIAAK